jgi:phospholipid-binding lipoprotein MlaA
VSHTRRLARLLLVTGVALACAGPGGPGPLADPASPEAPPEAASDAGEGGSTAVAESSGSGHGAPAELPAPDPLYEDDWLLGDETQDPAVRDPLEGLNRGTFRFNEAMRRFLFTPITRVYEFAVPDPGRRAIFRLFANLGEPVIFVNDVLQGAPSDAGTSGARFVINSTLGVAGLFDPATRFGLERHETDFGQTLAVYRLTSGPYFIVPLFGPATVRDALGTVVDAMLRPDTWLVSLGPRVVLGAGSGLAIYQMEHERLEALRETSVDFYAALRGAYLLDRDAAVDQRIDRVCGVAESVPPGQ